MFEMPETFQAGITSWFRGPERAFAVRQGDLSALEDVAQRCCDIWNGANSLIIPVRSNGSTWPTIDNCLDSGPVEDCLVHDAVSEEAVRRLSRRLGSRVRQWVRLRDDVDERELHPLLLQPSYQRDANPVVLRVPRFQQRRLHRIALICWGRIRAEDRDDYGTAFRLEDVRGPAAHAAMLDGQLDQLAPLE